MFLIPKVIFILEIYLKSYQASMMELFVKNVNCYKPLTIFAKKTPSYIFVRLLNTNLDADTFSNSWENGFRCIVLISGQVLCKKKP